MRILVIRGGALGDFLVTLPTLKVLRERWNDAHIELLGHPHIAEIALHRYYLNAVRSVDHRCMAPFFIPNGNLASEWTDYIARFDLVLSFFYDPDELFLTNLTRCDPGRIESLSPRIPVNWSLPASRYFGQILEPLGLSLPSEDLASVGCVYPRPEDEEQAEHFLKMAGAQPAHWVAVHPSSGSKKKNLPLDKWVGLLQQLSQRKELRLILIEGLPDEEIMASLVRQLDPDRYVRARQLSSPILAALLKRCSLYIGHDTGITHLAASSNNNLPIIALFGPTDPKVWAPPHPKVCVIQKGEDLAMISVESILSQTLQILRLPESVNYVAP